MGAGRFSLTAGFFKGVERQLFHLLLEPEAVDIRGTLLFLHPFAEEMHMARRNVAVQARALASSGYRVMLPDLTGCGDAEGDFSDARWGVWLADARAALDHLHLLSDTPVTLWGLRLGGLLASVLSQERTDISRLLLWQPVINGEQQVDQFLRLRTAASLLDASAGFDRKTLWGELRAGRSLEIAGYELSSELALEVARVRLVELTPGCPVSWVEVGDALARPSLNVVEHWRERGVDVRAHHVRGDAFWRVHDASINTPLHLATGELLQ